MGRTVPEEKPQWDRSGAGVGPEWDRAGGGLRHGAADAHHLAAQRHCRRADRGLRLAQRRGGQAGDRGAFGRAQHSSSGGMWGGLPNSDGGRLALRGVRVPGSGGEELTQQAPEQS